MKAILKYGNFTDMIELPTRSAEVSIMKPQFALSVFPLEELDPSKELGTNRLVFRVKDRINDNLWLYEFVRED